MQLLHLRIDATEPDAQKIAQAAALIYDVAGDQSELIKIATLYLSQTSSKTNAVRQTVIQLLKDEVPEGRIVKVSVAKGVDTRRLKRVVDIKKIVERKKLQLNYHGYRIKSAARIAELKELQQDVKERKGGVIAWI